MKDWWVWRLTTLLTGGLAAVFLPSSGKILVLGILLLFMLRLWWWKPQDFFSRLFKPEIILLSVTLIVGYLYGLTAETRTEDPIVLDRVKVVAALKDWQVTKGRATGEVLIESCEEGAKEGSGFDNREFVGKKYYLRVYPEKNGTLPGEWSRVLPGDRLSFSARLERPKPVGTPTEFDLRVYYAVRGISGTLTAKGDVILLEGGQPSLSWRIRNHIAGLLDLWSEEQTGVLEGVLFGDSNKIPEQIKEQYRITGVLHVFAASGSNVAFVAGLSWAALRFLPLSIKVIVTSMLLILYALLCGGNIPVIRAAILGIAVLVGQLGQGNKKVASLRWLLVAGAGLFFVNPLVLKDVGFQLSFLAAWGIGVIGPRLGHSRPFSRLPGIIRPLLTSTLGAQITTIPVLVTVFHRLSIIGFLVNVFILFVLGSVLELGLIGVALSFWPNLSVPFFQVSLWLLEVSNWALERLAEIPLADVWVLHPGHIFWILWYCLLGFWIAGHERIQFILKIRLRVLLRKSLELFGRLQETFSKIELRPKFESPTKNRLEGPVKKCLESNWLSSGGSAQGFKYVLVSLLILVSLWSPWNLEQELELVVMDVGQGDSILIRTPAKHAILVDAGPKSERFDAGEKIVFPYLLHRGIKNLDALLLTHEHLDHTGGADFLLDNLKVDWVGVPQLGGALSNGEWGKLLSTDNLGRIKTLQAGDIIELDSGAWLSVLGPSRVLEGTHSDPNNNSLVLSLNYLGKTVMLAADIEEEGMAEIQQTGLNISADLFKIPHHGSRFSLYSPFLDSIYPQAALISVGKNSFGHPSEDILEYWEERQIPVYRTDEDGTIRVIIGKRGFEIIPGRI